MNVHPEIVPSLVDPHQADPGRFEDATGALMMSRLSSIKTLDRDPRRHLASPRTWRDDCYRSHAGAASPTDQPRLHRQNVSGHLLLRVR